MLWIRRGFYQSWTMPDGGTPAWCILGLETGWRQGPPCDPQEAVKIAWSSANAVKELWGHLANYCGLFFLSFLTCLKRSPGMYGLQITEGGSWQHLPYPQPTPECLPPTSVPFCPHTLRPHTGHAQSVQLNCPHLAPHIGKRRSAQLLVVIDP